MATTEQYLKQLKKDKQTLVDNLNEKGVEASSSETFTTLAPKVLDISGGGDKIGLTSFYYFNRNSKEVQNNIDKLIDKNSEITEFYNALNFTNYTLTKDLDLSKANFADEFIIYDNTLATTPQNVNIYMPNFKNKKTKSGNSSGSSFKGIGYYKNNDLSFFNTIDTSNITNMYQMFVGAYNTGIIPVINNINSLSNINISNVKDIREMFRYNAIPDEEVVLNWCFDGMDNAGNGSSGYDNFISGVTQSSEFERLDKLKKFSGPYTTKKIKFYGNYIISGRPYLEEIDLSRIYCEVFGNCYDAFSFLPNIKKIDIRNFEFPENINYSNRFYINCNPNGVIIVKDDEQKRILTTKIPTITSNVVTKYEYDELTFEDIKKGANLWLNQSNEISIKFGGISEDIASQNLSVEFEGIEDFESVTYSINYDDNILLLNIVPNKKGINNLKVKLKDTNENSCFINISSTTREYGIPYYEVEQVIGENWTINDNIATYKPQTYTHSIMKINFNTFGKNIKIKQKLRQYSCYVEYSKYDITSGFPSAYNSAWSPSSDMKYISTGSTTSPYENEFIFDNLDNNNHYIYIRCRCSGWNYSTQEYYPVLTISFED